MAKDKKKKKKDEEVPEEGEKRRQPRGDEDEDEEEKGKKGKKAKKAKKEKKEKVKKEKKPKKPMSAAGGFLMAFLFFILLDVVALGLLYFNVGGFKQPVNELFNFTPLALEAEHSILNDRQAAIEAREEQLKSDQEQLAIQREGLLELEKEVNNTKDDVEKRENQLKINEEELDIVREELNGKVADLQETVKVLEQMDTDASAAILGAMTDQDQILLILKNMKPAIRSEILAVMPVDKSSVYVAALAGS